MENLAGMIFGKQDHTLISNGRKVIQSKIGKIDSVTQDIMNITEHINSK
jgi:chromosomal replication initiation ATPase DnaA